MANVQPRYNKEGKIVSYSIRVHRGRGADGKQLKPYTATFEVQPTWTEKSARKKAEAFAAQFEKACKDGTATDTRKRFDEYCEYVIELKEDRGAKAKTVASYREIAKQIVPYIGHLKLKDIRAEHLNTLYSQLAKGAPCDKRAKAHAIIDLKAVIKNQKTSMAKIADGKGISVKSVSAAAAGRNVELFVARAICEALNMPVESAFVVADNRKGLSPSSILKYHRVISIILEQALKEGLVPYNAATRAEPPKQEKKTPNYFQPEQIAAIREALESEPLKWKTLVHLLLITGARRGEILGLKWDAVDFENNRIHIHNSVLYLPGVGIYEDTPKTEKSVRWIALPQETMLLLRRYRFSQTEERLKLGEYYENHNLLFAKDNGQPMHPDTVTDWLKKFSDRHNLPHINPHAFRHTMASMLYFNGMDSVSISQRLGHSQVSTTANIYSHVIEEADKKSADILADVFLKKV